MGKYIIADNQEITRYALESLIRQNEENTVYRASDKTSLVAKLKEHENATVILDYTLFDFADEDQLLIVSERFALSQWLLISDELTPQFLRRVIYSSHQFSIVFKDGPMKDLRDALNAIAKHERFISQKALEVIINQQYEEEKPGILTATEAEIVKAIAQGKTTKEIAEERFSSVHTITTHRKNIFRKLGVNTAHEVVKYAIRAGLIDPSEFYI
ncbi:helix-turn-helix transcriptional regulator [Xylanibacter ruminicola]|jgi:DNA-binding NarL/FixJ family response regulator|uniref:DNA-binding response regulator, NarL/FixJ family, contains REC and HTH domains n=1 Tax=Xylanibacter ruminicola TaxID=839 RepID=A0A1M6RRS0_XYLRU|nr:response regulator transcription factor [Xylanibacter ruminicola]SHK35211.1 DNA-binding response regulator, NarL/FixJ family, contains REC and HTH domains [Xylanibacter ruminicola]